MAGLDLWSIQNTILEYAQANMGGYDVFAGGVEEAQTLAATKGELRPHVVLRFGSPQPYLADASFGGARLDGVYSTVDAMCVGPSDRSARQLSAEAARVLLGYRPSPNAGELNFDFGGGSFTVISEGSRPQFYISWVSMRFLYNLQDTGA